VHQLEFDGEQAHSDIQSKQRQLSDLAATANDLRQQLGYVHDQLMSAEKEVCVVELLRTDCVEECLKVRH